MVLNTQNLVPIQSTERARELGRKGGKSRSYKKSIAQRIRYLREAAKEDPDKSKKRVDRLIANMVSSFDDPRCMDWDILETAYKLKELGVKYQDPRIISAANKQLMDLRKIMHGTEDKQQVNIANIQQASPVEIKIVKPKEAESVKEESESSH